MSKLYNISFLFFLSLIILSCADKKTNENGEDPGNSELSFEERKKRGDTLALSPEVLEKALPQSVGKYQKVGDVQNKEVKTSGSNWSSVSQTYSNGEKNVNLSITDYNGAYGLYAGATAIFNSGLSIESDNEISRPYKKNGKITGWESFSRETGEASLTVGMQDRFLIVIESEGQEDTGILREFAEGISIPAE
jgi:hypothetical protein